MTQMTAEPTLVSIYLRPYLVDYFVNFYGEHPIKADEKSKLLPMLAQYLTCAPAKYRPLIPGKNVITFALPYNKTRDIRCYNYISPDNFSKIQSYLYNLFRWHFFDYMDKQCLHKNIPYKVAIINFMDYNNISFDNFQYDSLKRIYFRYRKKGNKIINIL
jgi:hypothetical protein